MAESILETGRESVPTLPRASAPPAHGRAVLRRSPHATARRLAGLGVIHIEARPPGRTSWSPEVYELFGADPGRPPLTSEELLERVRAADRSRVQALFAPGSSATGDLHVDFAVPRKSGELRHVHGRRRSIPAAGGRTLEWCVTLQDVTERVRSEQRRLQARDQLADVAQQATVAEVASGLAHEISQPLAAISTFAMAAARLHAADPTNPELDAVLREISAQAHRAGDALKRLIALAQPSASRRRIFDLVEEVRELGRLIEGPGRLEGVDLTMQLPDAGMRVDADPLQIRQLLLGLYRNAVEAPAVAARPMRHVCIGARIADAGCVEVTVEDNGPGAAAGVEPMLFMPFFTTKPGGTGLGLVTARSIARLHGGELSYRPREGGGAAFVLRLPLAEAAS